jgi:hypothetical protein
LGVLGGAVVDRAALVSSDERLRVTGVPRPTTRTAATLHRVSAILSSLTNPHGGRRDPSCRAGQTPSVVQH